MTRNTHSEWHADGTRAPSPRKRGSAPTEIWARQGAECVPLRAIGSTANPVRSAESRGYSPVHGVSGTEWHECPLASIRVHGRAS